MQTSLRLAIVLLGALLTAGIASSACNARSEVLADSDAAPDDGSFGNGGQGRLEPDSGRSLSSFDAQGTSFFIIEEANCGASPGWCSDKNRYHVDLDGKALFALVCTSNSDGSPPLRPKKTFTLNAKEIESLRSLLGNVRWAPDTIETPNGKMWSLYVAQQSGATIWLSPSATCGSSPYNKIVSGFEPLWSFVSMYQ